MAIFTPRGLKIRLQLDYTFALMARLFPKVDAFRVLKTTEGLEQLNGSATFIVGFICFYLKLEPVQIGILVFTASFIITVLDIKGLFLFPGLVSIGTLYSYLTGYGLLLIVLSVAGLLLVGWQGVLAFFAARLLAGMINGLLNWLEVKRIHELSNLALTASERHFFNAYRLHASRLGITTDISVTDEELKRENWEHVFEDLAAKWPEVVSRFTTN